MLQAVAKACTVPGILERIKPSTSGPLRPSDESRQLMDLVASLRLQHFGPVSLARAKKTRLPDPLEVLEIHHPSITNSPGVQTLFPAPNIPKPYPRNIQDGESEVESRACTVFEDPQSRFVMQVFMLPKGCSMPLHDHPGMTVITKMLAGSMQVVSYDYPSFNVATQPDLGMEVIPFSKEILTFHENIIEDDRSLSTLFPNHGNLHSIIALENTLFFDILAPPYSHAGECTYYKLRRLDADGKTVGWEDEGKSLHSLFPKDITSTRGLELKVHTDKWYIQPFYPEHFTCLEAPWHGEQIHL